MEFLFERGGQPHPSPSIDLGELHTHGELRDVPHGSDYEAVVSTLGAPFDASCHTDGTFTAVWQEATPELTEWAFDFDQEQRLVSTPSR